MVHRENSEDLPPFWEEKDGRFLNVLTNYCTDIRPEPLRGGILADDMGLGKTLTLLSLIAFDKCTGGVSCSGDTNSLDVTEVEEIGEEGEELCASSAKKRKRGRVSKKGTGRGKKCKMENNSIDGDAKGKSLEEHTIPGKLKTYMYYGDRTKDIEELKEKIEWWRVILDEAHLIKNANAQQSQAVTNLNAKRRWAVTVQRPLTQGSKEGLSRLQVLMSTISLRRTKDKGVIGLPPKTVETCYVELSGEERELYDKMERMAKGVVQEYISDGSLMRNYSTVLSIVLRLRQICTNLALCPSDLRSILPSNNIEDVSNNPDLLKKLVAVLQDGEDFDCPICISPPADIRLVFKFLRLDGSMNARRRAEVIEEFRVPETGGPTVLLASLKASGAGINLAAASRVFLLEPWWNPAVEEQAMDRVHRIGQKEGVKIVRLIARNSIEERILELQERKKKLAREAFRRKRKDQKEVSVDDLRILMSLTSNMWYSA
ncbi:hypothetical protein Patl1_21138 [Pistacia atlantica]|uniref:Uncharacterized protein n=1 Tax=Pistacia atlantica TaxID=434234 RepID=A0ACC1BJF5_9ROSI|nr:hypothetical protein Patl1_21138 [Pistacia atlantica]